MEIVRVSDLKEGEYYKTMFYGCLKILKISKDRTHLTYAVNVDDTVVIKKKTVKPDTQVYVLKDAIPKLIGLMEVGV